MIPDKPKGISKLRFWGKNRRVNRINDLPIFMQQRRSLSSLGQNNSLCGAPWRLVFWVFPFWWAVSLAIPGVKSRPSRICFYQRRSVFILRDRCGRPWTGWSTISTGASKGAACLLFQDEPVELLLRKASIVLRAQEEEREAQRDPSRERDPGRSGHERRHARHR